MAQRVYTRRVRAGFHVEYQLDRSVWASIFLFWVCTPESILGTGRFHSMTQHIRTLGAVAGFYVFVKLKSSLGHLSNTFEVLQVASAPENEKMLSPL